MPQVTLDLADRDIDAACKEYLEYLIPKIWDTLTPETAVKLCNIIIYNGIDNHADILCGREEIPARLARHGFQFNPNNCREYDGEKPLAYLDYNRDIRKEFPDYANGKDEYSEPLSVSVISMTRKEAKERLKDIVIECLPDEIAYFDCLQEMIMEVLGHTPESLLACIIAEYPSIIVRE